jgi:hypothetical protein
MNFSAASFIHRRSPQILIVFLLTFLFLQEILSMRLLNASSDETTHLPSGYTYLKTGQLRLNLQHPPLIKLLCGIPLLFLNPQLNLEDSGWKEDPPDEWRFGFYFLYMNGNDADKLLFWGRLPVVFLSLLLGVYVYRWAYELFGVFAGLTALFLYVFCPNIIAHARFVTMDLGLSCFFFMTLYYLWKFVGEGRRRNLIATGISLGLALATKFSAVILLPTLILLLALSILGSPEDSPLSIGSKVKERTRTILMFSGVFLSKNFYPRLKRSILACLIIFAIAGLVLYASYFFPRDPLFYVKGMMRVNADHNPDYPAYLMGHFKKGGWWYYFPLAFLFKTPIPTLILLVLTLILIKRCPAKHWIDDAFLILPMVIFTAFTCAFAHNLGIRYILPIYPLIFVFVSRLIDFFLHQRLKRYVGILLGLWYLMAAVSIYPDYLAYFNELVGGPAQGYKYLDDSNIEWGQDLKRLKTYLDQHGIYKVKLLYSWNASPDYYGIRWERLSKQDWQEKPSPGIYAINTHALIRGEFFAKTQGVHTNWLSLYKPIDRVGYAFYIFKFD